MLMDAVYKWYNFPRESSDKGEKKEKKKLFPLKEKQTVETNDITCLGLCVSLGKAGTFCCSPRAELLSFDFSCAVYSKAVVS